MCCFVLLKNRIKRCGRVVKTINTILAMRVSWSDVTSHQSSIARSTWLGVAEARTLKLDFVVKQWQNQVFLGYLFTLYADSKTIKTL